MKRILFFASVLIAVIMLFSVISCGGVKQTPVATNPPATTPTSSITPTPSPSPTPSTPAALSYPFADSNMFFGMSLINARRDADYVKELGVSWLSLEPHVVWMAIEQEPGVYDWSTVDVDVVQLQALGLDFTMVLSPIINAFGEERQKVIEMEKAYPNETGFLRNAHLDQLQLWPHDETLPLWINFVRAAVERYDGDGKNDMPGLKYAIRNWHFVEEYPCPEINNAQVYADLLKTTYQTIKSVDPQAKVIISGLAGNYLRYFAFMDGLIDDENAGVIDNVKRGPVWWAHNPFWNNEKTEYESILAADKDYFDIMDIHCYIVKEDFLEGEIAYIKQAMAQFGYTKPIWVIEGGGPFKNYPGKKAENTPADTYFGFGSEKENAEFVIKLLAMSAAQGIKRDHWGLGLENTDEGYWDGPWKGMSLMDPDLKYKKPSYYNYKMMREKVGDFTAVQDLSQGDTRLFAFRVGNKDVYIAWTTGGSATADLSAVFSNENVKVTQVVTELDANRNPVYPDPETVTPTAVPLSITPVFIEL